MKCRGRHSTIPCQRYIGLLTLSANQSEEPPFLNMKHKSMTLLIDLDEQVELWCMDEGDRKYYINGKANMNTLVYLHW